jgi:hypothetical protein
MKMIKTVGLFALLPMLSFAFFVPFPVSFSSESLDNTTVDSSNHVDNSEKSLHFYTEAKICPFIEYVDNELCNRSNTISDMNVESNNKFKDIKNKDGLNLSEFNLELDPKELCPLLELVDKSFCKSGKRVSANLYRTEKENIDPKDLCPLLELIETKLCS